MKNPVLRINEIEKLMSVGSEAWESIGINRRFGNAYCYSRESGADLINFYEVIWDNDVEEIIDNCKKYGITAFTISNSFPGLLDIMAKFKKMGCRFDGIVTINGLFGIRKTQTKPIPAFKLVLQK